MADLLSWHCDIDNVPDDYSSAALLSKSTIFQLWRALIGAGWTVAWTSAYVDSAWVYGATDYWGDSWLATKFVRNTAGNNHTCGVLTHATLGHSICFDLSGATDAQMLKVIVAKTAFTGGTAANRPTSVDELGTPSTASAVSLNDGTASLNRVHLVYATSGEFIAWGVKNAATSEQWGLLVTSTTPLADSPTQGFPVVYLFATSPFTQGVFFGEQSNNWHGKSSSGKSTNGSSGSYPYLSAASAGYDHGSYSAMAMLPASGALHDKRYPTADIGVWLASGTWGEYKGKIPDVGSCPANVNHMELNVDGDRRAMGVIWVPGLSSSRPTY